MSAIFLSPPEAHVVGTLQETIKALFREKITYRTEVWEITKAREKTIWN